MDSKIELRVLKLLCSRLCHDLISPVKAVNNGIELLADHEDDMSADIRDLLTLSAGTAAAPSGRATYRWLHPRACEALDLHAVPRFPA